MENIKDVCDGTARADGSVSLRIMGDAGGQIHLRLTPGQAGELVAAICGVFSTAAEMYPANFPADKPPYSYGPLTCMGIGFGHSVSPDHAQMTVKLAAFALAFDVPRDNLAWLGERASAMATLKP